MTEEDKSETVWKLMERMHGKIAAEIRVMLMETPFPQHIFDEEQQRRRVAVMRQTAECVLTDEARHEVWVQMHLDAGWLYGDVFDPVRKTHPNLMPWYQLPPSAWSKARIFDIVARTASQIESMLAGT